jgi:UDP-N-acetyl-D-galactosamine dehydrogenase
LAVIGLGYVACRLPLSLQGSFQLLVSINQQRIEMMRQGIDPSNELEKEAFDGCDITFTNSLDELARPGFLLWLCLPR